jgi:hypothetical protein
VKVAKPRCPLCDGSERSCASMAFPALRRKNSPIAVRSRWGAPGMAWTAPHICLRCGRGFVYGVAVP